MQILQTIYARYTNNIGDWTQPPERKIMQYPKKILIYTLRDGTPVYETVKSEEEYENLCILIEENKEYVRNYFRQYCD